MRIPAILMLISCLLSAVTAQTDFSTVNWQKGFFDFHWDETTGKIYVLVDKLDTEVLYNTALAAGVGSNDLGLDRGQLGGEHVAKFHRIGNKVLLIEQNYSYRALSVNPDEQKAVDEAFAQSTLWGFEIKEKMENGFVLDFTKFLLRDAHRISSKLSDKNQGNYKVDQSRSAIHLPNTRNFPKNTEFEAIITFTGTSLGEEIRSVTPSPNAITIRLHHSFIELPDDEYRPRSFDPRCGFSPISFHDYASPIHEPVRKQLITRHRLTKKNPTAAVSEAVEPIVYYLDPGAPEPIRSALIDGASWWAQAFEATGYKNAFRVEMLPSGADPLDVRYNVIQWVHRSTRGWSYGGSVVDPRTGEIIKGHVSLGSLRVRQDYLIAQGLLAVFDDQGVGHRPLEKLALARLRQLSAHEIGHTLGLAHNFAASVNGRASVMDYPHPFVSVAGEEIDFSKAYDDKIGAWDKRAILYGYQDFDKNEAESLKNILEETEAMGLHYMSDQDARGAGSAHPYAHLWDNGPHAAIELKRITDLKATALKKFGLDNISDGTSTSYLEEVLVPLYFSHRYQVEATAKLIGGLHYSYDMKDAQQSTVKPVSASRQKEALDLLLSTLDPSFLRLSERILNILPPRAMGESRTRELFKSHTQPAFDPVAAAASSASHTINYILNPQRLNRVVQQHARFSDISSVESILDAMNNQVASGLQYQNLDRIVGESIQDLFVYRLMSLTVNSACTHQVRGAAINHLNRIREQASSSSSHSIAIRFAIDQFLANPHEFTIPSAPKLPDGSPIGAFSCTQ